MNKQQQALALQAKRQELFHCFYDWSDRKVMTALAIVNNIAGTAAMQYHAMAPKSGSQVMRRGLNWLQSLSRCGQARAVFALAGTVTMARKYWAGLASTRAATLRAISSELEELGLFKIVSPGFQSGYNSHTKKHKCREYHRVNLAALLVAHEQLEEVLSTRQIAITEPRKKDDPLEPVTPGDVTYECLDDTDESDPSIPKHHAQWGRALFNALFEGVAEYRRGDAPCSWTEGAESFDAAWGLYGVDEDGLEAQAASIPCHETLGAMFQRMADRFGAGFLAMIERAVERHPEWDLYVDDDRVAWVPF